MLLYHGSNIPVPQPRLLIPERPMDFGSGFYLTSDLNQAQRWAQRTTSRRHAGIPKTSVYKVDLPFPEEFKILHFVRPDEAWLDFVIGNRTNESFPNDYDIVIGPVANDQTILTINLYIEGLLGKDAAIAELLPQRLSDQYTFRTPKALALLQFQEVLHE